MFEESDEWMLAWSSDMREVEEESTVDNDELWLSPTFVEELPGRAPHC